MIVIEGGFGPIRRHTMRFYLRVDTLV